MATIAVALPRPGSRVRFRTRARRRHWPIENTLLWTLAFAFFIFIANYLVFHVDYMIDDAYARIDNAFNVLFTSDPHLAAIGFFWPPLPSFLELPLIAFKGWWPALVTKGFAGSIEASAFTAGSAVLINSGLRWAGVVRGMRWVICAVWVINPMNVVFAAQGMSEAEFVFFFIAALLVFLRWAESRRTSLLPLMGILAGLDALCRDEALLLAFLLGIGVLVQSARNRAGWREIETTGLLYGLPAIFVIGLWLGSAAVIMHDPLYLVHANTDTQSAHAVSRATAYGLIDLNTWGTAANFVVTHSLLLFPGIVAVLAMLAPRLLIKKGRVAGLVLLGCGLAIPALDIYLVHSGGLAPSIRYQISVIPFAFLIAIYVLRSLRGRWSVFSSWGALVVAALLGVSNLMTAETLLNPSISSEEEPALVGLATGQTVEQSSNWADAISIGPAVAAQVEALDTDGGRILCDSADCFPIVLNVPDPHRFTVTSDRDFEAAAAQPLVYDVEYFLVPPPEGLGAFDRLNVLYPDLYDTGGGFATLVGQVSGPAGTWRLYRITGPTGRG